MTDREVIEADAASSGASCVAPPVSAEVRPSNQTSVMIGAYALLIVIAWMVLELWGLGAAPFHTKGEPREGLVVWEMTHGGGWILPRRNGVELPSKPPLFHWLGALTSLIRGTTDEWSIRFPSAALSLVGVLCVFAAGVALWTPRAGLFSALALMTTFEWARAATNARVDMTLTFGLELAFLSWLFFVRSRRRRWLIPLYLAITLAVLGKGPVGAALPGLVALVMIALARDVGPLRRMHLGYGAVAVGLGAGSWYVMALLLGGYAFFRKQVLAENVFTFLRSPGFGSGHSHGIAYLFGALVLGVLPWSIFLPGVGLRLWRSRRELSAADARVYLLVWIGVVFGFYAVAASKRSVYLLALYPALALLLGWWFDEQSRAPSGTANALARFLPLVIWPLIGVGGLLFLGVVAESLGAPLCATVQHWLPLKAQPFAPGVSDILRSGSPLLLACLVAAGAASYAGIWAARAVRWAPTFAAIFLATAAVVVAARQVIMPGVARQLSPKEFMAAVRTAVGPAGDLSFYKTFDYGAVFYWHGHIPVYDGSWPDGGPRNLLMERAEWDRAQDRVRAQFERVTLPARGTNPLQRLVLVRRVNGGEAEQHGGSNVEPMR